MKKTHSILLLTLSLCFVLMGCSKKEEHLSAATQATETETASYGTTASATTEEETPSELPYTPGRMGVYVMADPEIEAGSEVLDNVSFGATDGAVELNRYHVSNRQHDLVKNGMQVGGFILIDIPKEMLNDAAESFDGFKALAEHVGKQVLPDIYPGKAIIGGGGHTTGGSNNSFVVISYQMGEGMNEAKQWHRIYVGEKYCYDFWYDQTWFYDGGEAIMESLSAADIKPEWNREAVFHWTVEEVQEQGKFVF